MDPVVKMRCDRLGRKLEKQGSKCFVDELDKS